MHFSLPAADFKTLIATAKLALHSRITLPILATVHCQVSADGHTLTATTTDLDITVVQTLPLADPGGEGEWCLDFKTLASLRPAKDTAVRVVADTHAAHAHYTAGGFAAAAMIPHEGAEEFPHPPPPDPDWTTCKLPARTLAAIATALPFASEDETRYVLNGVLLTPSQGGCAVATDGRRLIQLRVPATPTPCILPTKLCAILARLKAPSARASIKISGSVPTGTQICLRLGTTTVHSKLIEGNYPNFKQVIPTDATSAITFTDPPAVAAWLLTLRESKGEHTVKLVPRPPHSVELVHPSGSITASAYLQDAPPTITFNPRFLASGLTAVGGTLYLTHSGWAGVLRCPGSLAVLMPMRTTAAEPTAAEPTAAEPIPA